MPRSCDACQVSSALVFCRADVAYLCMACDLKVHGANMLASRHERVWICEVCEQAPAIVTCKADAASLCFSCDADIHSANPLASRHERVPVLPLDEAPGLGKLEPYMNIPACNSARSDDDEDDVERSAAEAESWLLSIDGINKNGLVDDGFSDVPTAIASSGDPCAIGSRHVFAPPIHGKPPKVKIEEDSSLEFFSEVDPFFDSQFVQSIGVPEALMDSIVPLSAHVASHAAFVPPDGAHLLDAEASPKNGFSLHSASLSHSTSSSSMEFAVVPDSTCSNTSTPAGLLRVQSASQLEPMAREARVLRYKERRKNRRFEKTIRYASRKAYAEIRPRIKGRFAKRTSEMCSVVPDTGFGVVPSL